MNEVIELLKAALNGYDVEPYYTTDTEKDCVIYSFTTQSNNGCVKRQRLKLTIIASYLATIDAIEEAAAQALLTIGDNELTENYLQCAINGGGDIYDSARRKYHRILYFDFIKRCE